jgi:SAM-dependent methyltransferase
MGSSPNLRGSAPPPRAATPERQAKLLALVEEVLRDRFCDRADEVLARLAAHLKWGADHVYEGVNPHREDIDPTWDRMRAALYGETVGVGAVHLELGTWTAFTDTRTEELIEADQLAEFIRLDLNLDYRPDVVADVTALPFRSGSIDRVASNSLIEHVAYPQQVLEETYRILRPGGVMVAVVPFVWMLHGYPDDYVRLTPLYFERICREVGFEHVTCDVESSGGLYNVLHNTAKMSSVDRARDDEAALRELQELVVLLLATLVPLDHGFDGPLNHWFHSVRCLARKPGGYEPSGRTRDPRRPFVDRMIDLLADPLTGAPLELKSKRLVCREYNTEYEVRGGIPVFTEPRHRRPRRGLLSAGRRGIDTWARQRMPAAQRKRIPARLRKVVSRSLGR